MDGYSSIVPKSFSLIIFLQLYTVCAEETFLWLRNETFFLFLAFAFAELVDNALAATADNKGPRKIEIQLVSSSHADQINVVQAW